MRKGSLGVPFFSECISVRPSVCPQILGNSIRNARDGWGWARPPPDPPAPVDWKRTGSGHVRISVRLSALLLPP